MPNVYTWYEAYFHVPLRLPDRQAEETGKADGDQDVGIGSAIH